MYVYIIKRSLDFYFICECFSVCFTEALARGKRDLTAIATKTSLQKPRLRVNRRNQPAPTFSSPRNNLVTKNQKETKLRQRLAAVYPTTRPSALTTARKELAIPSILGQTSQHTSSTEVINPQPPAHQTQAGRTEARVPADGGERRRRGGEGNRRSRRKGTTKHKRLLSASSE